MAWALAGPLALAAAVAPLHPSGQSPNLAFAFLVVVLVAASAGGLWPGVLATATAFLTYNFFFIEPKRTLAVSTSRDLVVLFAFLAVSVVVSVLTARLESRREQAEQEAADARLLFDLTVSLGDVEGPEALTMLAELARERLGYDTVRVELLADGQPTPRAAEGSVAIAALSDGGHVAMFAAGGRPSPSAERLLPAVAARAAGLAERQRQLAERHRLDVLQQTDQQRSALLAAVSHDLRTPLSAVKALAAALAVPELPRDERQELATSIGAEADRLDTMVRNLLDLGRIEGGTLVAVREDVPVDELVGSVLTRLRPLARDRRIDVDVPDELPAVRIDLVQVAQSLTNLVENALVHTPASASVSVRAVAQGGWVTVRVSDKGPGVAASDRERIFVRFERATGAGPGSGLGLAIARAYARASGGDVEIVASPVGAAFDLLLPAAESAA
jgi:two-component system sensor histidine kinase KdpD